MEETAGDVYLWLEERRQNAVRIAQTKTGEERDGWLEDASFYANAVRGMKYLHQASDAGAENIGIRLYIALRLLRQFSGLRGFDFDSEVVMIIFDWIDAGMTGPILWPDNPFFAEWAAKNGYSKIDRFIGFKFEAELRRG